MLTVAECQMYAWRREAGRDSYAVLINDLYAYFLNMSYQNNTYILIFRENVAEPCSLYFQGHSGIQAMSCK